MKKGVTLMEVLIALGMSAIVFFIVSTMMISILSSNSSSRRRDVFENAKNTVLIDISNSVKWAKNISWSGGLLIVDADSYRLVDGKIYKNTEPITPDEITITRFEIKDFSNLSLQKSYEVELDMENSFYTSVKDNFRFVVSQRKTEVDL